MDSAIRDQIRQFVLEDLAYRKGVTDFDDDEPLVSDGIVDSLGIFRLVSFFEDTFQIKIPDDEITADNFSSIAVMEQFVASRLQRSARNA